VDAGVFGGEALDQRPGAVRRFVIDKKDGWLGDQ